MEVPAFTNADDDSFHQGLLPVGEYSVKGRGERTSFGAAIALAACRKTKMRVPKGCGGAVGLDARILKD